MSQHNDAPLVSIIVITYHHVDYIAQCLDGLLKQETDFSFEIILGEDDSTDGTRGICQEYANKHPDVIRLFCRSRDDVIFTDGEPSGKFNFMESFKACRGKYLAMCEGDDYWIDPHKLQKQIDFLEANPDYSICFHDVRIDNGYGLVDDNAIKKVPETTTIIDLAGGNFIRNPSVVMRRVVELPDWYVHTLIGDFSLNMLTAAHGKIKRIEGDMSAYRAHENSGWSSKSSYHRISKTLDTYKLLIAHFGDNSDVKHALNTHAQQLENSLNNLSPDTHQGQTEFGEPVLSKIVDDPHDEKIFQKNLQAMHAANQHVTDWAVTLNDIEQRQQYVVSSDNAQVKGIWLHHETDPRGEAQQIAEQLIQMQPGPGPLCIMGFGMGYHLEALLEKLPEERELHIQLLDRVLFQLVMRRRNLAKLLANTRLIFVANLTPQTAPVFPGYIRAYQK